MYSRRQAQPIYRPPKRIPALVLIDMQKAQRDEFSYGHGTVGDGLRRTIAVIAEARALRIPLLLVTSERHPELLPEIAEAAKGARTFRKNTLSAFWAPGLVWFINDVLRADTLVVGGWARHLCVRETVLDLLGEGYSVMTSDQILFGKQSSSGPLLNETELRGFRDQLLIYPTSEELIHAIRK